MLSIVIPAHNEEDSIARTLEEITTVLRSAHIAHELVVVDDHSKDGTWSLLQHLGARIPELRPVRNEGPGGFGNAIRWGLGCFAGDRVTIMMADLSDDPQDLVRFNAAMDRTGCDCVFGSRAKRGAQVTGYPRGKWIANRLANWFLCAAFQYRYDDTTNPFKLYSRAMMERIHPLRSGGFELEIEIPLNAIVRRARYIVLPNHWRGREAGESKMKLAPLIVPYLRVVGRSLKEKWTAN